MKGARFLSAFFRVHPRQNLPAMKKSIRLFIVLLFAGFSCPVSAEIMADLNGNIQMDHRLRFENQEFSRNDVRLMLKLEGSPFAQYHYYTESFVKGARQPGENDIDWSLDVREAYLDLYEFISDNLDLRIGKQMIIWGTADKLNPTSNICPDDLEDTFDFGEKLGINALNATYYWADWMLNAIAVPVFTPARLPSGDMASALAPPMSPPPGVSLRNVTTTTREPELAIDETSQFAVKLSGMLFDYDVSFSYFNGRDDLPLTSKTTLTPVDLSGTVDVEAELTYPRMQVIGADFAGSLNSVGVWGEAALVLPEHVEMPTYLLTSAGLQQQTVSVAQKDDAYVKFVLGMDYTFESGWFINMQYLHGFFNERSKDELHDYLVGRIEQSFLNDELKIVPFGFALTITDWDDMGNNYGIAGMPEISYYPVDNVELTLGFTILEGEGDNMFSSVKDNDEVYFKAKVSF